MPQDYTIFAHKTNSESGTYLARFNPGGFHILDTKVDQQQNIVLKDRGPLSPDIYTKDFDISPTNPNILVAGGAKNSNSKEGEIDVSLDGGKTWRKVEINLKGETVEKIKITPDGKYAFATLDLVKSTNNYALAQLVRIDLQTLKPTNLSITGIPSELQLSNFTGLKNISENSYSAYISLVQGSGLYEITINDDKSNLNLFWDLPASPWRVETSNDKSGQEWISYAISGSLRDFPEVSGVTHMFNRRDASTLVFLGSVIPNTSLYRDFLATHNASSYVAINNAFYPDFVTNTGILSVHIICRDNDYQYHDQSFIEIFPLDKPQLLNTHSLLTTNGELGSNLSIDSINVLTSETRRQLVVSTLDSHFKINNYLLQLDLNRNDGWQKTTDRPYRLAIPNIRQDQPTRR